MDTLPCLKNKITNMQGDLRKDGKPLNRAYEMGLMSSEHDMGDEI